MKLAQTQEILQQIRKEHSPCALASSFGLEDMVLTDLIAKGYPEIAIFTLDTGRLPEETYDLMQRVKKHYGIEVQTLFPDNSAVENYIAAHGPNGFYDSVELRKKCCRIRKVEPLQRALAGKKAWITGLRRQQSPTREGLSAAEFDREHGIMKFNPLLEWTEAEVWAYIKQNDVPCNQLHDRGYPSLGCEPCTRAISRGEDIRAGRWWWEEATNKECGLHQRGEK